MSKESAILYPAIPRDWLWLPKPLRKALGIFLVLCFVSIFVVVPLSFVALVLTAVGGLSGVLSAETKSTLSVFWAGWLGLLFFLRALPRREWEWGRKLGQLYYELFEFSTNVADPNMLLDSEGSSTLSDAALETRATIKRDAYNKEQFMVCMHPHGVVPYNAILWVSWCDQYYSCELPTHEITTDAACRHKENPRSRDVKHSEEKPTDASHNVNHNDSADGKKDDGKRADSSPKTLYKMYGFGATADITMQIPFLRNVFGWFTAGGASYSSLKKGLVDGKSEPANAVGRKPRNLYILPGGIGEIGESDVGRNAIVFKNRKGLCRLSLETGAQLMPTYVFGINDCYRVLRAGSEDRGADCGSDGSGKGLKPGSDNVSGSSSFLRTIMLKLPRLLRKMRVGFAFFWGPYWWFPIWPFFPRITMVMGEPISIYREPISVCKDAEGNDDDVSNKLTVDELHEKYVVEMKRIFDKYKTVAGYEGAELEIL